MKDVECKKWTCYVFSPAWKHAMTQSNIKSGFMCTGTYPVNPTQLYLAPVSQQIMWQIWIYQARKCVWKTVLFTVIFFVYLLLCSFSYRKNENLFDKWKNFSFFAEQSAAIHNSVERSLVIASGSKGPCGGLGWEHVPESDDMDDNGEKTLSETCQFLS